MSRLDYPVVIKTLPEEDGGGFIATAPDLKGCMSVGETPNEALDGIAGAIDEWLEAWAEMGRPIPAPGSANRRVRDEHREISKRLRELEATTDDLDSRIKQLQADLEEHIENLEAWDRFDGLVRDNRYSGEKSDSAQLGLRYEN